VYALINVHGYLVLNGEIEAIAGAFFSGNTTNAKTDVELSLSEQAPQHRPSRARRVGHLLRRSAGGVGTVV
jgi:hypothetical protein